MLRMLYGFLISKDHHEINGNMKWERHLLPEIWLLLIFSVRSSLRDYRR